MGCPARSGTKLVPRAALNERGWAPTETFSWLGLSRQLLWTGRMLPKFQREGSKAGRSLLNSAVANVTQKVIAHLKYHHMQVGFVSSLPPRVQGSPDRQ